MDGTNEHLVRRISHLYEWTSELYVQARAARAELTQKELETGEVTLVTTLELFAGEVGPLALRISSRRKLFKPREAMAQLQSLQFPDIDSLHETTLIPFARYAEVLDLLRNAMIELCRNTSE